MTNSSRKRESAVRISSAMPSAKYSCSGSLDTFWNGSTAIEGLSGRGRALPSPGKAPAAGGGPTAKARTGSSMFLTVCGPRSV
jgi:hypothetical protein